MPRVKANRFRELFRAPPETEFCIFRNDPLMRAWLNLRVGFAGRVVCCLVLFLAPKIITASIVGVLTSPSMLADITMDARSSGLYRIPARVLVTVLHVAPFDGIPTVPLLFRGFVHAAPAALRSHALIPYLRDYSDIALMVLMAVHMALLFRQWTTLSQTPSTLWDQGIINRSVFGKRQLRELMEKYEKRFNNPAVDMGCLALATGLVWMLYASLSTYGVFSGLVPAAAKNPLAWQRLAYGAWWGNPSFGAAFVVIRLVIGIVIVYYMLRHNANGMMMVGMLREFVSAEQGSDPGRSVLVVRPGHHDGCAGLAPVKRVLVQVYFSILIMGLSLLILLPYMPMGVAYVLVPLFAIFLFANPYYIAIPLRLLHLRMRAHREHSVSRLAPAIETLRMDVTAECLANGANQDPMMFERYRALEREYERVASMPVHVFSFQRTLVYTALYVVPILLLLDSIIRHA